MKVFKHVLIFILLAVVTVPAIAQEVTIEGMHYMSKKPVAIKVNNGFIQEISPLLSGSTAKNLPIVSPGLIDNQVNGYYGISFAFGGSELTHDGVLKVTMGMWEKGITSYLPTLTTNSNKVLLRNLKILAESKQDPKILGSIPGFHLEGPYISPFDGFRGAHPAQHVRKPNWEEFLNYYKASGENILTVTVAPEIEGMMSFIKQCKKRGIVVALGHHNANKEQVDLATLNGAEICTHLGNGCANMINRHDNPLWPQLANNDLSISIICDGFHLRDEEIKVFYDVKGPEKTILTSDITSFAGLKPGNYINEDGDTMELMECGLLRYPKHNVLYGSATPINRGVVHIMNVTKCSLANAIKMGSTNPAKLYGLHDRGELKVGMRADIILFEVNEREIEIQKTFVRGKLVYNSEKSN